MRSWLMTYLRCPGCQSVLDCHSFERDGDDTVAGVLICQDSDCAAWYPIWNKIPRMLPDSLRGQSERHILKQYGDQVSKLGLLKENYTEAQDSLRALKEHTIDNFGFEWLEYARFGWDDPVFNLEREERVFFAKTFLSPEVLRGSLVLDAGCGNGRYSHWAAAHGGRVIGIDLGDGVESAVANLADHENVQIVQGDIFNLPFADSTFEVIFAIGVLMHTGDARRATNSLIGKLKSGGSLSLRLYGRGNLIYEFVDATLRRQTSKMPIPKLMSLAKKLYATRRFLERTRTALQVTRFVRLDPHPHCIFDWYAAPIATHHTYDEVYGWLRTQGLEVAASHQKSEAPRNRVGQLLHSIVGRPQTVTVKAIKP